MMQILSPRVCNEPEAPPWYDHHHGPAAPDENEEGSETSDQEDFEQEDINPGDSDDAPSDPGADPHPPANEDDRQSVLLFHLDDVPIHTMLHWVDYDRMMNEVALHFAIDRVDLLACHGI